MAVLLAAAHSAFGTLTAGLHLDALPDIRLTRELCDKALSEPKVQRLASETLQARVQRIQRLAAEGDPVGELGLAGLYAKGDGVPRSLPEAAKWCQKAAEAGLPLAQTWLGEMYDAGEAVPADPAQAVKWYEKAEVKGFPPTQFDLAVSMTFGAGTPTNYPGALKLFKKAAEAGHPPSERPSHGNAYEGVSL